MPSRVSKKVVGGLPLLATAADFVGVIVAIAFGSSLPLSQVPAEIVSSTSPYRTSISLWVPKSCKY